MARAVRLACAGNWARRAPGLPAGTLPLELMIEIAETLVLTLDLDTARRQHIVQHFHEVGIRRFGFWPATPHDDPVVLQAYRDGVVRGFPGCFRCGLAHCACSNNVLVPQQVANWLSFLSLWRSLPDDPSHYVLLCEDDVAFHHGAMQRLAEFTRGFQPSQRYVLVRMAHSGLAPFTTLACRPPVPTGKLVMSNAAYLLNGSMAALLVRSFTSIATTSDIWLHQTMASAPEVQAVTLEPLLATDLSFNRNHARFISRIHPKGIDVADLARKATHRMRADSPEQFQDLLLEWGVIGG